jgi:tRNA nucleotidyltransferase/poly(A) polymerase
LINIYQNTCGSRLEDNQAEEIICALLSVRDSERLLQSSPCHLLQVVFENKDFYNKTVYPCDTIGLRNILANKKISSLSKIIAFSNSCSDRIIKDQKLRIFINLDPEKIAKKNNCQVKIYGGMAIFDTNCLDISDCIDCIVTEGGGYEHIRIVQGIIAETKTGCPVYTTSFIPGVDKYKFGGSLNEYEINLPSLGIFKEKCRAQTPLEALKIALAIRWNRHPDRKIYKRKPENYNAEFWANSGFFDSIVRPYGKKAILANNSKFAQTQISLTPQEQNIFNSILSVAKAFNLKTQFRVAGGWIRDKILGKSSDDIDIALDDLTGRQFYDYCSRYAKENPNSDIGKNFGKSYVVEQNVEKSKHLETVAIEIGGSKIDFVNLRSESYGENSRIPTVEFGNPETDAKRRDLTINALFYNINTGQIEDYVGGLQDLKDMILRTPMDPVKTFNDDPLRMLRVLRFYSRYPNAKIEQSVLSAMSRPEVHESYRKKVASERAGPEILKMFGSERPAEAIRLLFSTGLDKAVFDVPETKNLLPLNMNQRNKHHKFNLLEHTLRVVENLDKLMKKRNVSPKDRVNMLLAAVFHDYGKAHPEIGKSKNDDINEYSYVGHEDKSSEIADSILKKIGVPEEDRKFVSLIVKAK